MSNMSYCRFQNTLADLHDCCDALSECETLSEEEQKAAEKLIALCRHIVEMEDDDE